MKKSMKRLMALALALILALGASAMAAETASNPYRVPGVKQRPDKQSTESAEGKEPEAPEQGEQPSEEDDEASDLPADGEEQPPVGGEQPTEGEEQPPVEGEQPAEGEEQPPVEGEAEEPEQPAEPEAPVEEPKPAKDKKQVDLDGNGSVRVRSSASTGSDVIGHLSGGDIVEVLGTEGNWTKVRLADGTEGYVATKFLADLMAAESGSAEPVEEPVDAPAEEMPEEPAETEPTESENAPESAPEKETMVASGDVNVRLEADGMSEIVETATEGAEIIILEIQGDWVKVQIGDVIGWVYIDELPGLLPDVPEEAEPEAEPDPEHLPPVKVTIFTSRRSVMAPGETVYLTSKIENLQYYKESKMQWQVDTGSGFVDVPGATGDSHSFEASVETLGYDWKLLVYYR